MSFFVELGIYGVERVHRVEVESLEMASVAVTNYIVENEVTGRDWTGGRVFNDHHRVVARVSYNGRVWDKEGKEIPPKERWKQVVDYIEEAANDEPTQEELDAVFADDENVEDPGTWWVVKLDTADIDGDFGFQAYLMSQGISVRLISLLNGCPEYEYKARSRSALLEMIRLYWSPDDEEDYQMFIKGIKEVRDVVGQGDGDPTDGQDVERGE